MGGNQRSGWAAYGIGPLNRYSAGEKKRRVESAGNRFSKKSSKFSVISELELLKSLLKLVEGDNDSVGPKMD